MRLDGSRRQLMTPIVFLSESLAYFEAMRAAGYSASQNEKIFADSWIRKRKADGSWDKIDRAYLHIGTLTTQLMCCKSLTSRTAVNSPVASANGLTYNGSNNYTVSDVALNTLTKIGANDAHAFSMFSSNNIPVATLFGAVVGSDKYYLHGAIVA